MKAFLSAKPLYFMIRLILGGLFVYAGILKLSNPYDFAMTINLYGIVTWRMSTALSYIIPCIEIITGLGLLLDVRGALAMIVAQLLGFMAILVYAMYIGLDADCGCFGTPQPSENDPTGPLEALLRDGVMLAACAVMYWQRIAGGYDPKTLSGLFSRSR